MCNSMWEVNTLTSYWSGCGGYRSSTVTDGSVTELSLLFSILAKRNLGVDWFHIKSYNS